MKRRLFAALLFSMLCVPTTQAYLIQGLQLNIEYWAGSGVNECVIAIDWNNTNGPYNTEFHIFGYRWDALQTTVKDALIAFQNAGSLAITYAYGGGFIGNISYDQTGIDGDYHTAGQTYFGWWWGGETSDGGLTWQDNSGGVDEKSLRHGGIEGFNIDGFNWGSQTMTIPEPATIVLLGMGVAAMARSRRK